MLSSSKMAWAKMATDIVSVVVVGLLLLLLGIVSVVVVCCCLLRVWLCVCNSVITSYINVIIYTYALLQ